MQEIIEFIKDIKQDYEKLYENFNLSEWNAEVSGKEEDFKKYSEAKKNLNKFLSNKEKYEKLKEYNNQDIEDELLARQVKVMYNQFLSCQGNLDLLNKISELETQTSMMFNNYRAEIRGKKYTDNELKKILRESVNEEELKAVWESNKSQGAVVEKNLIELIHLRNKLAKDLGYNNYYEFSLKTQELDSNQIKEMFEELAKSGQKTWNEIKEKIDSFLKKKFNSKNLKPWHYHDFFFQRSILIEEIDVEKHYKQDVVEIAKKFYTSIGLPVESVLEKSSLYEQPGKSQHAFAIDIDRKGDVRTLNNIKNNKNWMATILHELGHCIYWKYMDPSIPFLIREYASIFATEALANLMGRLSNNPKFIEHISEKISKEESKKLNKLQQMAMMASTRFIMVMVEFEREMYTNPNQNLNTLWWEKVEKYQGIKYSRDRPDWASKIHFVIAPTYYHNYLLGEIFASQIHNKICEITNQSVEDVDYFDKPEIGKFLKENIFDAGNKYYWDEMIKKATGEKLTTKYFEKEYFD